MQESKTSNVSAKAPTKYPALFGLAYRYRAPNGAWLFGINYLRVAISVISLICLLWILLTVFIFVYIKHHKGWNNMSVLDAIEMPFNRGAVNEKYGEYDIQRAKDAMEQRNINAATKYLYSGLQRSPRNLEARKMLAKIYIAWYKRNDYAVTTLETAIPYAYNDFEYVRLYLSVLMELSEDAKIVAVGEKILEAPDLKSDIKKYIAMTISNIYALHGNYTKSDENIKNYDLYDLSPAVIRLSRNQWEQGHREEAIKIAKDAIPRIRNPEPIYGVLMNYYTSLGNFDEARHYAILRSIEKPFEVKQRIEFLRILEKSGETERVNRELDTLYMQNSKNEKALLTIANFATDQRNITLMNKIYNSAIDNGFSLAPFTLLMVETLITSQKYKDALAISEEIVRKKPSWLNSYMDVFNCLRSAAYSGDGNAEMAGILINEVLKSKKVPPRTLITTAKRFSDMGDKVMAHKILSETVENNPRHQLALTRLIQIEILMGNSTNLDKHIFRLIQMRRPPRDLILEARKNLDSDLFIFTANREKVMEEIESLLNRENTDKIKVLSSLSDADDDDKIINFSTDDE